MSGSNDTRGDLRISSHGLKLRTLPRGPNWVKDQLGPIVPSYGAPLRALPYPLIPIHTLISSLGAMDALLAREYGTSHLDDRLALVAARARSRIWRSPDREPPS